MDSVDVLNANAAVAKRCHSNKTHLSKTTEKLK